MRERPLKAASRTRQSVLTSAGRAILQDAHARNASNVSVRVRTERARTITASCPDGRESFHPAWSDAELLLM